MLLDRRRLIKTSAIDQPDWNYRWLLGRILRLRYKQIIRWLPNNCSRLLEIGYGSGVLMPTLQLRTNALYGLDVHLRGAEVKTLLAGENVRAELIQASAEAMPFAADTFDCIVAVSALEFFRDLNRACLEIKRILAVNGKFIAVTPIDSRLLDVGLKVLTGRSAKVDFDIRRRNVIPALRRSFSIIEHQTLKVARIPVYNALLMTPSGAAINRGLARGSSSATECKSERRC
jgi:SAM-dependent methyltransferase